MVSFFKAKILINTLNIVSALKTHIAFIKHLFNIHFVSISKKESWYICDKQNRVLDKFLTPTFKPSPNISRSLVREPVNGQATTNIGLIW